MDAIKYCPNPDCAFREQHGMPAEYELEVVQCLDCDTPLQIGAPAPNEAPAPQADEPTAKPSDMVAVAAFPDPFEANMALSWLRDAGMEAILTDRCGTAMIPALCHGGAMLRVPSAEVDRAARLLDELRGGEGARELPEDFFDDEPDEDTPQG